MMVERSWFYGRSGSKGKRRKPFLIKISFGRWCLVLGAWFLQTIFHALEVLGRQWIENFCIRSTRYLQDYLEGKKCMSLILTPKPGEEDYLDTSYLMFTFYILWVEGNLMWCDRDSLSIHVVQGAGAHFLEVVQ
ncbi:Kinesin-like protein [Vigna unguiculata]|uniref:Kinesin-like protein n=1 Tax=Vigna unguiculata TaxID=3917 RepID=A0A4D6N2H7_VIGUN|nr:Kinesin-like protein [Vigna unguiculata]